jgi:CHAD domain-containing protein
MMLVNSDAPLWIVSRGMISSRCEELINYWRSARKSFSPEDIHDLRVASRRLREAITIFAPCYPSKKLSHIRAQSRNLTNLLGVMRNTDEALLFFTPLLPSLPKTAAPSLETWLQSLSSRRSKGQKLDPNCAAILTDLIASNRKSLYADYLTLHTAHPVDKLGESARELL